MFNRDMVPLERNHACDSLWGTHPSRVPRLQHAKGRYYAEVPALALSEQSRLIEQLIGLAFDALGARHLDVRVRCADQGRFCATGDSRNETSVAAMRSNY